ncbi:MAG: hypothetical protein H8E44_04325 [Planctomycetes bacterium]|nr:hypothetical protein [Planctomycetota bacterium]
MNERQRMFIEAGYFSFMGADVPATGEPHNNSSGAKIYAALCSAAQKLNASELSILAGAFDGVDEHGNTLTTENKR